MKNGINKISVYGDSILKGAVTGTGSGHLFDIIEESSLVIASRNLGVELNNQSVFGSVVSKTQRRLNKDIEKGVVGDLAILESGGNDCDYDWTAVSASPEEEHLPRTTLEDFIAKFDEMVQACREAKITPVVMTMPPLVGDRWFEHICNGQNKDAILKVCKGYSGRPYLNHERYNAALIHFCIEKKVQWIDMRKAMLDAPDYRALMCLDGIHPNEEGYRYMATVWEKELPELKKEF